MNALAVTHLINGILMIVIGVGMGILLIRHFGTGWRLWWIGATTFIISQIGHIPFNALVGLFMRRGAIPAPPDEYSLVFTAVFLGLSAGIWEECTRYAAYRWWAVDARSWPKGLVMGAGHGGIEAIILGLLVLYTYVQMLALRGADLTQTIPPDLIEMAQQQINAYWSLPWYTTFLGSIERLFAMIAQLTLSVLVLQVFTRKRVYWLFVAIFWHALIDALAVYTFNTRGANVAEYMLAVVTVLNLVVIMLLKDKPTPAEVEIPSDHPRSQISASPLPEIAETQESLERTRYN